MIDFLFKRDIYNFFLFYFIGYLKNMVKKLWFRCERSKSWWTFWIFKKRWRNVTICQSSRPCSSLISITFSSTYNLHLHLKCRNIVLIFATSYTSGSYNSVSVAHITRIINPFCCESINQTFNKHTYEQRHHKLVQNCPFYPLACLFHE